MHGSHAMQPAASMGSAVRGFDPTTAATDTRPQNDGTSMNDDTARLDGVPKIDGSARYGRDVMPRGVAYARFVRCPYGRGRLAAVDEDAARAVPGVQ